MGVEALRADRYIDFSVQVNFVQLRILYDRAIYYNTGVSSFVASRRLGYNLLMTRIECCQCHCQVLEIPEFASFSMRSHNTHYEIVLSTSSASLYIPLPLWTVHYLWNRGTQEK